MSPIGGRRDLTLEHGPWRASAHTRPAFYEGPDDPEPVINVDDVMLVPIAVAGEPAVAVAIAHGNYKDNGCAIASAAAIAAAEAELSTKFLGEADVGPALRRALFAADARVREAAKGRVPDARFLPGHLPITLAIVGDAAS